jgi:predicted nucleotidyltransferase
MVTRDAELQRIIDAATDDDGVVGLFIFGSRGRADGMADESSDYDVAVILRDADVVDAFDRRWPYRHGAAVEIATMTLSQFQTHGEYGSPSEWARPQYTRVRLLLDKTGEIESILAAKSRVPDDERDRIVRDGIDGFINATYRSLRYGAVGALEGARLDAAESLPPLLSALFGMDGRVRPFNKYLYSELSTEPLSDPAWRAESLMPRLMAVLDGDADQQHALFREAERVARGNGYGDVVDSWEPDVRWLRGDAPYRQQPAE